MSSQLFAIPETKNSENCQYFEPVTPISSSDEELSNSPTAFEEQSQQEFPFCQSNNNYVAYEDNAQVDSKISELSPYASGIQYNKTSKSMLPSYSDSTSPRGDPIQLGYQSQPSPVQEARIFSSYSENKTSPSAAKGVHSLASIYGSEVYRPYENSDVNGYADRRTTPNNSPVHEPRIYSAYSNEKSSNATRNIHSLATIYGSDIYKPYESSLASIESNGFADRRPTSNQPSNTDLQSTTSTSTTTPPGANIGQKRARTQFTSIQLVEMEREFTDGRYLSRAKRIDLAQRLGLTEKQIKVWFQNRRMKFNRDTKGGNKNTKYGRTTISPQSSQSDAASPQADRSDTNRLLRHSPLLKYEYNSPLGYQGFSSNQWNDSMYYSTVYNPGVSSSDSYLNNHSLYNNNYASGSYASNFTPSYESSFSSGLPGHLNVAQPIASKPTFEINVGQPLKKEHQEYPPNVTVSWGASAAQSELLEL